MRLLARAFEWAIDTKAAHGEVFNVTNGDVYVWEQLFETAAAVFGMEVAAPAPQRLATALPEAAAAWDALRSERGLVSPPLTDWVGDSPFYADALFGTGREGPTPPMLLSTIKLREAGFGACIDTEDMLRAWLEWLIRERWIPA